MLEILRLVSIERDRVDSHQSALLNVTFPVILTLCTRYQFQRVRNGGEKAIDPFQRMRTVPQDERPESPTHQAQETNGMFPLLRFASSLKTASAERKKKHHP